MGFQVTEVQSALKGAEYPSDGETLARIAEGNGAGGELVEAIRGVGQVDGPPGVMEGLQGDLGGSTDS